MSSEPTVIGAGRLTETVQQLTRIMQALVEQGKTTGAVTLADWQPLAELCATDGFERIGPFHDRLDWAGYSAMLTDWVNHSEGWLPVVKSITEAPGVVYMQCEEMITQGDTVFPFYSLSLYRFNERGQITSIAVYMQNEAMAPPA
ncbi:hypothetical protein [Halioxenophilus sp. WMMB6]|uniref:hypothetical protein n=1 Tax=Halioxenophilus sp. WMMB6 TaxID=3073815 RepID=UPI00295EC14F|nr:hypothetical protein [Halioxenophilus sp. WMMB6]